MYLKKLLDQIKEYEECQASCVEETKRYEERLEALEKARKEVFDLVASDNANDLAHSRLDHGDREIADLKKEINSHQRKTRSVLHTMRTRILQAQEKADENLKTDLETKNQTLLQLKNELIPKAEARLGGLREKETEVKERIKQIRKESRKVTRLNLDRLV